MVSYELIVLASLKMSKEPTSLVYHVTSGVCRSLELDLEAIMYEAATHYAFRGRVVNGPQA